MAQAAAVVNAANSSMQHYPGQPAGMDDALYALGYQGASSSNLWYGTSDFLTLSRSPWGYMDDSDVTNIQLLGHRRWMLNPLMAQTGFGYAANLSTDYVYNNQTALYCFDTSAQNAHDGAVAWPATTMPVELFDSHHAWSYSSNELYYGDITVYLIQNNEKMWSFDSMDQDLSGEYLGNSQVGTGQGNCIIFRPNPADITYAPGDVFEVDIRENNVRMAHHTVTFFSTENAGDAGAVTKPEEPITPEQSDLHPFTDVPVGATYEDAVIWAVDNWVTSGTSATTFSPNDTVTRAQAVTFLWNASYFPTPTQYLMPFTDVANREDNWYLYPVLWAVEEGITSGTSATAFSPEGTCTKGEIITFLWRSNGSPNDMGQSPYYADAVQWARSCGILSDTQVFSPNSVASRSDVVTYLYHNSING